MREGKFSGIFHLTVFVSILPIRCFIWHLVQAGGSRGLPIEESAWGLWVPRCSKRLGFFKFSIQLSMVLSHKLSIRHNCSYLRNCRKHLFLSLQLHFPRYLPVLLDAHCKKIYLKLKKKKRQSPHNVQLHFLLQSMLTVGMGVAVRVGWM